VVHLKPIQVKFPGQGHRLKFKVIRGKCSRFGTESETKMGKPVPSILTRLKKQTSSEGLSSTLYKLFQAITENNAKLKPVPI